MISTSEFIMLKADYLSIEPIYQYRKLRLLSNASSLKKNPRFLQNVSCLMNLLDLLCIPEACCPCPSPFSLSICPLPSSNAHSARPSLLRFSASCCCEPRFEEHPDRRWPSFSENIQFPRKRLITNHGRQ